MRFEFTPVDRAYYNFGPASAPDRWRHWRPAASRSALPATRSHAMGHAVTLGGQHAGRLGYRARRRRRGARHAGGSGRETLGGAGSKAAELPRAGGGSRDRRQPDLWRTGRSRRERAGAPRPAVARPGQVPPGRHLAATAPGHPREGHRRGARYGIDTVLPGMLFAAVRHSPLVGTRIAGIDNAPEVSSLPGVSGVVRLGSTAVAVVAADSWTALRAAARLSLKPEPADRLALSGLRRP
ncbi:MAG: hypothetical protein M5R42_20400 [Rhodocyclaceae bacterium]|nr:hypothetical protein [Rhodocyclaceae bacterium]